MPRILRNTLILFKLEPIYATDSVPTGAADALLVSAPSVTPLVATNVGRDLVRGYLGGSEQLVGTNYVEVSFTLELAGSGTATTPPAWGRVLKACGFAETVAAASVDYLPTSAFGASTSATIYYYVDGQVHRLVGARGTFIGRSFLYGLGAMGEEGVTRALEIIARELDLTMALCGRRELSSVDRSILVPGTFG